MSRSYFIVLNDEEQRLYNEGSLRRGYFSESRDAQMYAVSRYDYLAKEYNIILFTNTKRLIYEE